MDRSMATRSEIKPFRVTVRVKNNRMVKLREELGLNLAEFSRRAGVQMGTVCALENFRKSPWTGKDWRPIALKIAEFHGVSPEWLWPEVIQEVKKNAFMLEANAEDVRRFKGPHEELENRELKEVLETKVFPKLLPIEKVAVVGLAEGTTATDLGKKYGLSKTRISQMGHRGRNKVAEALWMEQSPLERSRLTTEAKQLEVRRKNEEKDQEASLQRRVAR